MNSNRNDEIALEQLANKLHIPVWSLRLLISGGDKVVIGFLFGYVKAITPVMLFSYVEDSQPLLQNVKDSDWEMWRVVARLAKLKDISKECILKEFEKRRLDLLGVIINHPNGDQWLEHQLTILQERLGLPPKNEIDYTKQSPTLIDKPPMQS